MSHTLGRRTGLVAAALALAGLLTISTTVFAGTDSTSLPNGAQLSVSLDSPPDGSEFLAGSSVNVSGSASIGLGEPNATIVYIIDRSGSTTAPGGACGSILQCQKTFVTAVNNAAIADGSVANVGLGSYETNGAVHFGLGAPTDPAFAAALASIGAGNLTDFGAGLAQAVLLFSQPDVKSTKLLIFLSDGLSNDGSIGGPLAQLQALGVQGTTIAAGSSSNCAGGSNGTLNAIASGLGGQCYQVDNVNDLPDLVPSLIGSTLQTVLLTVDGGLPFVPDTVSGPLPAPGATSMDYSHSIAGLAAGDHQICAIARGSDVTGGVAQVQTCITVHLLDIDLAPGAAINELGTPGQTHTVTATVTAGSTIGGRTIDFQVLSGPNAGAAGSDVTDAAGEATFTYAALQGTAGLGADVIEACLTVDTPTGPETRCRVVTKLWQDTTPPDAACEQATNPSGRNIPRAGAGTGNSGQNPDGFYVLTGADAVGVQSIVIADDGSAFVSGPFASGDVVKITQSVGGTPSDNRPGPGVVVSHLRLNGDAILRVTDTSGNVTEVSCLVPPPPR